MNEYNEKEALEEELEYIDCEILKLSTSVFTLEQEVLACYFLEELENVKTIIDNRVDEIVEELFN